MSERMNTTVIFDGIRFPGFVHTLESLKAASAFQFQDKDVLLVTFPKSGTTWMQQVLSLIFCEGHLWPIHHLPNWARVPWIEQVSFSLVVHDLRSSWPRLFTSHLGAKVLAPALMKSKVKVVYMARNPKDTLVSFYHFHRIAGFMPDPNSFEDFVDEFLEGTGFFGSWFDHVKGWLGLQKDLNLLFVTYEELHQEPRRTIQKLSEFLGRPLRPEEEDVILEHCSFSFMSQSNMVNYSLVSNEIMDQSKGKFLRKGLGCIGDVEHSPGPMPFSSGGTFTGVSFWPQATALSQTSPPRATQLSGNLSESVSTPPLPTLPKETDLHYYNGQCILALPESSPTQPVRKSGLWKRSFST